MKEAWTMTGKMRWIWASTTIQIMERRLIENGHLAAPNSDLRDIVYLENLCA